MSGKHTPGPWVARPDPHGNPNDCCIGLDDDCTPHDYVAVCHNRDGSLISAAPDLLAVLQEVSECAEYWSEYDVPLGIHERIAKAIAKAKGGAK